MVSHFDLARREKVGLRGRMFLTIRDVEAFREGMREEAKAVGSVGNTDALGPANLLKGAFRPSFAIGPVSEGLAGAG